MARIFARPILFASRCLTFEACRYNGAMVQSELIERLKPFVEFKTDCPEMAIGLGVPRDPLRVIRQENGLRLYQPATGRDLTEKIGAYAALTAERLAEVDGLILKSRSPSCGPYDTKLYANREPDQPPVGRTAGFLAATLLAHFSRGAIEDEGRLTNFAIRERFLTRVFLLADFRAAAALARPAALVDFTARNKLLLLAYNQMRQRELGRIVANHERLPLQTLLDQCRTVLEAALEQGMGRGASINVLQHAQGYFKHELGSREKAHFDLLLEQYRVRRLPLSALTSLLRSWIERTDQQYLRQQTFFEPFPAALAEIKDSGQGRDY